ncbi:MAG: M1 family metallopeptidase, partial [Bacteroidetes bacterium]|nr:M1 family metallopeptidase [Bacteroidota bacterium]
MIKGVVKEEGLKKLELNFYDNFKISEVKLNGIESEYFNEDKLLTIISDDSVPLDTFELKVTYSGTPKKVGLEGFVFGKINGTSLVYNLSEPAYASSWFPCNDFPSDKALLDIRIKNDSSQVSVSNGILIGIEDEGERRTYHWKTNYPTSTYLIAIYSSNYQHFSDEYVSLDKQDTMAIDYYVLENDVEDAKTDFMEHPEILRFFAETFGEYPFIKEKYGVAEFLWQLGAMEHQTITGVASNILGGKNLFLDIYIHELAHHWWGNAIGLKSWNDIWLNEGFSTYSEALYYEYKSGRSALRSTMMSKSYGNFSVALGNPGSFLFTGTVYNKGAWVLHMLRWELGDKIFFKILREYYRKYKYSNASTGDF